MAAIVNKGLQNASLDSAVETMMMPFESVNMNKGDKEHKKGWGSRGFGQ